MVVVGEVLVMQRNLGYAGLSSWPQGVPPAMALRVCEHERQGE